MDTAHPLSDWPQALTESMQIINSWPFLGPTHDQPLCPKAPPCLAGRRGDQAASRGRSLALRPAQHPATQCDTTTRLRRHSMLNPCPSPAGPSHAAHRPSQAPTPQPIDLEQALAPSDRSWPCLRPVRPQCILLAPSTPIQHRRHPFIPLDPGPALAPVAAGQVHGIGKGIVTSGDVY